MRESKIDFLPIKEYVANEKQKLKEEIQSNNELITLAVIQIDDNPASNSYIKGKQKDCDEVGIKMQHIKLCSEDYSQEELEDAIDFIASDTSINGVIVQLPIPDKYDVEKIKWCIPANKDVDGFRPDSYFNPCTPYGIMMWLGENNYSLIGKNVTVLGRSEIVGKPMTKMLIDAGATVTCCNSHTERYRYTDDADMVISAVGSPRYFNFSDCGINTELIVDVGINRDKEGKLCGDYDNRRFEDYRPLTYLTPVPGGVGLLTRLALLENVRKACLYQNKEV